MINLIKSLKKQGAPIDGIGIQAHLIVGEVPTTIKQNMQDMVRAGVEVAITELDIRMNLPATPALLEQQKQDYKTVIDACRAVPKCVGVTVWDWTDKAGDSSADNYKFPEIDFFCSSHGSPEPSQVKGLLVHGMR